MISGWLNSGELPPSLDELGEDSKKVVLRGASGKEMATKGDTKVGESVQMLAPVEQKNLVLMLLY